MTTHSRTAQRMTGLLVSVAGALALFGGATSAVAQPDRQDARHEQGEHPGWGQDHGGGYAYHPGERMGYNDWNNAPVVDYRARHLRRPRAGYEWREHNGRYVMVAVATGVIASVLLSHH